MDDILLEIVPLDLGIDSKDKSPLGWKYLDNSYRRYTTKLAESLLLMDFANRGSEEK